jgi:transposase-like protein
MSAKNFVHLACPNPDCPAYGHCGQGNLQLHGWSGTGKRIRCLRCSICGRDFSERANTAFFGMQTDEDTLVAIAKHLAEGVGVRATGRLCGVSYNTVLRCTKRFGKHAELFHDRYVRHVEPKQIQPDEAWSFVGKKRQAV